MGMELWEAVRDALGMDDGNLGVWETSLRAAVIYLSTLFIVRVGDKRFIGKNTAFDVILGIILGSVLSRAINGDAPLVPTLAAGIVLIGLHWLLAALAFRLDWAGPLVKGHSRLLVDDGVIQWDAMRTAAITEDDLLEALRGSLHQTRLDGVEQAYLERNGSISFVTSSNSGK